MIQLHPQLAIFLENRPGMLALVCDALGKAKINIYAMSTSDTVDHIVIRMVVSDPRRAVLLFEERGTLVVTDDVLMVEGDNRPRLTGEDQRQAGQGGHQHRVCLLRHPPEREEGTLGPARS